MSLFKTECVETHVGDLRVYKDRIQVGDIVFITTNNFKKYVPIEWLINYEIKNGQETRLQEAITQWEKENEGTRSDI